jgi:hypothetical protein
MAGATALHLADTPPDDLLVDAVGVTQDGWVRFTSGTSESVRDAEGNSVPTDVYKLHVPRNYECYGGTKRPAYELRVERYASQGETYFVSRLRVSGGDWEEPSQRHDTLGDAKRGYRLRSSYGRRLQEQLIELRRRRYAQSVGVDFVEYERRYKVARARQSIWQGSCSSAEACAVIREAKLDAKSISSHRARVLLGAKLDDESIAVARAQALREAGLDPDSVRKRQETVLAEHGIGSGKGWPLEAAQAWHKRAKDFRGFFGCPHAASEAACQEFPELWS